MYSELYCFYGLRCQDGTNAGLREAGVDARLSEIGCVIEEVISSFEMELGGSTIPIKPIRNLTGHSIAPYRIHAGNKQTLNPKHQTLKCPSKL